MLKRIIFVVYVYIYMHIIYITYFYMNNTNIINYSKCSNEFHQHGMELCAAANHNVEKNI